MPGNASTPNVTLIEHPQPTSGVKRSGLGAVDVVFPSRAQFRSVYDAGPADLGPTARMFEHGRETRRPRATPTTANGGGTGGKHDGRGPRQRQRTEPLAGRQVDGGERRQGQ